MTGLQILISFPCEYQSTEGVTELSQRKPSLSLWQQQGTWGQPLLSSQGPQLGQGHRWPVRESVRKAEERVRRGQSGLLHPKPAPPAAGASHTPRPCRREGGRANWSGSPAGAALRGLDVPREPAVPLCCGLPALPMTGAWCARPDSWGRLLGRCHPRKPRRRRCPADELTPDHFQAWLLWCRLSASHGGREGLPVSLRWPAPCQAVPRVLCPCVPSATCGRPEPLVSCLTGGPREAEWLALRHAASVCGARM